MRTLVRALIATVAVCAAAAVARPFAERAWFVYTLATQAPATILPSPLASHRPVRLVDSWGNPRSGGRHHQGIDIFAPKDTPVLSTTSGIVTSVGTNRLGGQVVWILGPGLERHYYVHLNRYGVFRAGDRVEVGAVIGYAGNTGNARGGPAHLHYGIYSKGTALNPYPRLSTRGRSGPGSVTPARPGDGQGAERRNGSADLSQRSPRRYNSARMEGVPEGRKAPRRSARLFIR